MLVQRSHFFIAALMETFMFFSLWYYYNGDYGTIQRLLEKADCIFEGRQPRKRALPDAQLRANAVMVILARNEDLGELKETLISFEYLFNSRYNYPYVIFNDKPFKDDFVREMTKFVMVRYGNSHLPSTRNISFGVIPKEHWSYPEWIDQEKAAKQSHEPESYHHMCRFYSGFFYRHPLLEKFDYYWRIEPHVRFFCQLDYDPFAFMMHNNIEYGLLPISRELLSTVPSLWNTTLRFLKDVYPTLNITRPRSPVMNSLIEDPRDVDCSRSEYFRRLLSYLGNTNSSDELEGSGLNWNLCHFYNNFEIAHLTFFRSSFYQSYFEYLDKAGGFYYERWGDSPIHSMAVGMFLDFSQIHHFDQIGYEHQLLWCPIGDKFLADKCFCNQERGILNYDLKERYCYKQYQSALASSNKI